MPSIEHHRQHRVGWLRAAVLGANDGIVSTSSLIIGVASAQSDHSSVLIAGLAALVAGAISMAAGEYVSVCSQADTEKSDLELERQALENHYDAEVVELSEIYQNRGVDKELSIQVAKQLMEKDALAAHARDEIGISELTQAQPLLAAGSSALSFICGAAFPLFVVLVAPSSYLIGLVAFCSLVFLSLLGATSSYMSGAPFYKGVLRVTFWGALAMFVTALTGRLFGVIV